MVKRTFYRSVIAAILLLVLVAPALAHEPRVVGPYMIAFGWRNEPAYVGLLNGPEIFVSMAPTADASATAEATGTADMDMGGDDDEGAPLPAGTDVELQVVVSFGGQSMNVPVAPLEGDTGHWVGDLIPMLPGDYSFHVTGTIGTVAVDQTFTSADGKFSTVEPVSDIQFPAVTPSP